MRTWRMLAILAILIPVGVVMGACALGGRGAKPDVASFTAQLEKAGYTDVKVTEVEGELQTEDGAKYIDLRAFAKAGTCDVEAHQTAGEGDDHYYVKLADDNSFKSSRDDLSADEFIAEIAKGGISCGRNDVERFRG